MGRRSPPLGWTSWEISERVLDGNCRERLRRCKQTAVGGLGKDSCLNVTNTFMFPTPYLITFHSLSYMTCSHGSRSGM